MSIKPILNSESLDNKTLNLYCNSITTNNNIIYSRKEFQPTDLQSLSNNWRFFVPLSVPDPLNPPDPLLEKMNWILEEDDDTATITGKCRGTNTGFRPAGLSFDIPTTINLNKVENINFFGRARTKNIDINETSRVWNLYNVETTLVGNDYKFELFFTTIKGLDDDNNIIDIHFMITYQK